ncbi:peptide-methionine (S)-S-oxide reductase MsrA [Pelagibius sp. Alg239-R121]|uniref:peptide-methionine (S)-S-oxide reductase MsrA n=1 Tax=Pelagibius sp. Alg239-R121 TaxID=2993448 RepID=UPI0024A74DBF|nr:peptide-methionine (S)-S-oxide reductase MsrA [Pelagibius sp. Alg239-R121]
MRQVLVAGVFALFLAPFSVLAPQSALAAEETAIFAGGCFWCIESDFEKVAGVNDVISGYTGGESDNPTYKNHSATRHREAVQITYDPTVVNYDRLLEIFWRSIDPVDAGGQFCDRGHSYTTAIYATSIEQMQQAQASKSEIDASKLLPEKIVTPVLATQPFYPSEDYHQDYHNKNPVSYKFYRYRCGRNQRVEELWGDQAYRGIKEAGS